MLDVELTLIDQSVRIVLVTNKMYRNNFQVLCNMQKLAIQSQFCNSYIEQAVLKMGA